MSSIIRVAQSVASYEFGGVTYNQLCDDMIEMVTYLKMNKSSPNSEIHKAVKSVYWNIVMRLADENSFKKEN